MTPEEILYEAILKYARDKGVTFEEVMEIIIQGHKNWQETRETRTCQFKGNCKSIDFGRPCSEIETCTIVEAKKELYPEWEQA